MMLFLLKCMKNSVDHNSDFVETSVGFYFTKSLSSEDLKSWPSLRQPA